MKRTPLSLLVLLLASAAASIRAGDVLRSSNNATTLNTTAAWQSGSLPTASDVIVFDGTGVPAAATATTVTASNVMGAALSVQGIRVAGNVGGTANTTNYLGIHNNGSASPFTLSLGSAGVDMSAANQSLRIQAGVSITASQNWTVRNANTATNVMGFNNGEDLSFDATAAALPFNLGGNTVSASGAGGINITSGYTLSNGTLNIANPYFVIQGGGSRVTTINPDLTLNVAPGGLLHFQSNSGAAGASFLSNGTVNLNGGTLRLAQNNGTLTLTVNGTVNVNSPSTLNIGKPLTNAGAAGPINIGASLTGSAALNFLNDVGTAPVVTINGNNSGYSGIITFTGTAGRTTRLATATAGSAAATWNVSTGQVLALNNVSVDLGTLTGAGTVNSYAAGSIAAVSAGAFSGVLANGTGTLGLSKEGTGTLTLTGSNTYTGATVVEEGTLLTTPAQTGATPVSVAAGATFGVGLVTAGTTLSVPSLTAASGSTVLINTGSTGNPSATAINAGALDASAGSTTVRVTGSALTPGTGIPLIGYTTLNGFANLSVALPPRTSGVLVDNAGASRIDLNITGVDKPRWRGNVSTNWDVDNGTGTGTLNWREITSGTATRILQGAGGTDSATFDDTAATGTVNLTTTLTPAGITVDNSTLDYTFTGSGKISGSTSLVKSGSGTLALANSASNDYTGATTINAGTLAVGDGVTPGAGSLGSGPVVNNGTLSLNRPDDFAFAAAVTGSGTLAKNNTNTANFAASTTLGNVAVNSGTLRFDAGGSITGNLSGSGALRLAGGNLAITTTGANSFNGTATVSAGQLQLNATGGPALAGNVVVTGTGSLALQQAGQLAPASNYTLTGTSADSIPTQTGTTTVNNVLVDSSVSGAAGGQVILKTGLEIAGTATLNSGILGVGSGQTGNINAVNITCPPGSNAILRVAGNSAASTLNIGAGGITASGGEIQVKFNTNAQDAVLNLGGNFTATGNVAITNAGFTGTNLNVINLNTASIWDIAAGTTTSLQPDLGGSGSLIKSGAGTLTLTASSSTSYPGNTVVSGGVLNVLGSIAGSNVIAAGGTLAGTGLISTGAAGADINAGGKIAPGNGGAGALTINVAGGKLDLADAVTPAASGALVFDIDAPASTDQIILAGGALDIGSGVFGIDDIAFTAGAGLAPGVYTLIAGDTPISGTLASNVTGPVGTMTGTLSKGDSDTDLILTVTNLTALQSWRQTHFGTTANTGSAANDADPDGDGLANLIEYLFGTTPTSAASTQALIVADDGANFSLTYTRVKAVLTEVDVFNETSTDLTGWTGTGVTETILSDDGTTQSVKLSVSKSSLRRFLRVRTAQK